MDRFIIYFKEPQSSEWQILHLKKYPTNETDAKNIVLSLTAAERRKSRHSQIEYSY